VKYRQLADTGVFVSELCLGTMTFGGGRGMWGAIGALGQKEADTIVHRSLDAGINFIDTADIYSYGDSEEVLGKALGAKRQDVILATKVRGRFGPGPNQVGLSRVHIMRQVEGSLKRLGTDYIDLYIIHSFDPVAALTETLRALDDLVRAGKVRYIAGSNLAAWQLMKALAISDKHDLERFKAIQSYYSIAGRGLEREVVPLIQDQNVGLMVWSPLAGGFLSGKFTRENEGAAGDRRTQFDFPPINKDRAYDIIAVMRDIAQTRNVSVSQVALAWVLSHDYVTTVLIGAKRLDQLEENLKAVEIEFSADELARLDEISQLAPEYPGWMLKMAAGDRYPGVEWNVT
jgi:aryl-alcohol dehydrogenase-like predicted oxidoreductase